ncbi:MAG: hypothetical protein R3338_12390, partial [Thermoanaerobaculia bacterium]|nr:hypothetical protein [Thermoanaerobaculia bacterium]
MQEVVDFVHAMYVVRGLMAFVLAILLFIFFKRYRQSYLKHWTLSWLALAIYYVSASLSLFLALRIGPDHPFRAMFSALAGIAGYLMVGWLLFGAYELLTRSHVRLRTVRWTLPVLAVAGLLSGVLFGGEPALRLFVRVGVYNLLAGVAFLVAGAFIWRAQRLRGGFGYRLLAISFFFFALGSIVNFSLSLSRLLGSPPFVGEISTGMFDFLYLALIGLGMVASLLEDERQASDLALTEIEQLTYHDTVTGLPNRQYFMDRLI